LIKGRHNTIEVHEYGSLTRHSWTSFWIWSEDSMCAHNMTLQFLEKHLRKCFLIKEIEFYNLDNLKIAILNQC